ncbi:HD domain-containing protein [Geobacter sulfurreducens]|uniref:HD domain-containing protein n=1 Tax=Geobacter sulfurreducens TaxID=35554 RepID=UPI002028A8D4|nr:HD domain-containing protein [Geobacter sulfurreducens]
MSADPFVITTLDEEGLASLKKWFLGYCRSFYTSREEDNRNIRLKEEHTEQVCAFMDILTLDLGLDPGERRLAGVVALLHDVGRFEQYRCYGTFRDSESENHGTLGVRVLTGEGVLDGLAPEERRMILGGVALHNVFRIPDAIDGPARRLLHLVRDADKLDIWRVFLEFYGLPPEEQASAVGLGFPDLPVCTPGVVETVMRGELVNLATLKTLSDFKLLQLSWVFDLNFAVSRRLVAERNYVEQMAATLPPGEDVARVVVFVREYLARSG